VALWTWLLLDADSNTKHPFLDDHLDSSIMRVLLVASIVAAALPALAVKEHDFKKCDQSGFCRRGRALAKRAADSSSWNSPYTVDASNVSVENGKAVLSAPVKSSLYPEIKFGLEVRVHDDGVVRIRMDEVDGLRQRYDGAAAWALVKDPTLSSSVKWDVGKKAAKAKIGDTQVVVAYEPLRITLLRNGIEQVVLNGRGLLHMEHFRTKTEKPAVETAPEGEAEGEQAQKVMEVPKPNAWFEGEEDSYWEETFSSWTDSKPKGMPPFLDLQLKLISCRSGVTFP
jgi:mannosyl-oligosaccharide alpha-1,3-glucosidase